MLAPIAPGAPSLSRLLYGVWRVAKSPEAPLRALVERCLELGITSFDHADIYGDYTGEERFGAVLAELGTARDRLQLVTKCGIQLVSARRPENRLKHYDVSGAHILASVERSLRALRTDRIELLFLHRPDPLMEVQEVAGAFATLRAQGKVLAFGISNFAPSQVELLAAAVPGGLAAHQIQLSVTHLEPLHDGTLDQAQRLGMAVMAWSPLGGGAWLSPGGGRDAKLRTVVSAVAERQRVDPAAVALAFLLRHPARVFPVLGTQSLDRLHAQRRALDVTLDRQDWYEIYEAARGAPVP